MSTTADRATNRLSRTFGVRALVFLSALILTATVLVGPAGTRAEAAAPKPTKITLAATTKLLAVGQSYTATVKAVTPPKASRGVTWTSSNTRIATVTAAGRITARRAGVVTIRATSKASRNVTGRLTVTVSLKPTAITLTPAAATLKVGRAVPAKVATITPAKANRRVKWTSSNRRIATVTDKGVIRAISPGTATITAVSVLNAKARRTIRVTVTGNATPPPPVIDPKLLGTWNLFISNAGSSSTYGADGTWTIVLIFKGSLPYQQFSKGRYRIEGGKIHYSDIVYQDRRSDDDPWSEWKPAANPNRVENYAVGTDEYGEYFVKEDDPNPVTAESVKYYRGE